MTANNLMKNPGDKVSWRTLNGTASGTIEKVTLLYTVRMANGRVVNISGNSVTDGL